MKSKKPGFVKLVLVSALVAAVSCGSESKVSTTESGAAQAGDAAASDAKANIATDGVTVPVDPCAVDVALANPPTAADRTTPLWAFEPWISKDISTADDTRAFVQGFKDRGIPVGVVVLDSPWETNYHTFKANPKRYPGFEGMVAELHAQQVKVVVWMTSQVNDQSYDLETGGDLYDGPSPNFAEGLACSHYVNDGATPTWWKGFGAGLDFFSPAARTWWNRQQLELLQVVDGYKLDFGEMYLSPVPMKTAAGPQSLDAYSQAYYREMLKFGQSRNPEFVTMVRPWDKSYDFEGRFFANPEDAPVAWVGDNRRDWVGFVDALDHIFRSAAAGYPVVGSDIGGYLDRNDLMLIEKIPFDPVVFARWIAVGALGPFMQLHGRANLTPWTMPERGDELLATYTYWAHWHHQLIPMLHATVQRFQKDAKAINVMRPIGGLAQWSGDWRYLLGEQWLVAPLTDATGKREVALPTGRDWLDWWQPGAAPLQGGTSVSADFAKDLLKSPLYLDACSVQPFWDGNALTGLAPDGLAPHDGWLIAAAKVGERSFKKAGADPVQASLVVETAKVSLQLSARPRSTVVTLRATKAIQGVTLDGKPLTAGKVVGGVLQGWMAGNLPGNWWIGLPAGGKVELIIQ